MMKFIFISVVLLVNGIFFSFHTEAQKNKTPPPKFFNFKKLTKIKICKSTQTLINTQISK